MFDPIGEPTVRAIFKPEPNITINSKEVQIEQEQILKEMRPVEKSENDSEFKNERDDQKDQQTAKYKQEDNRIIYEKYNKNGELIFRIPPKQNPLDELA